MNGAFVFGDPGAVERLGVQLRVASWLAVALAAVLLLTLLSDRRAEVAALSAEIASAEALTARASAAGRAPTRLIEAATPQEAQSTQQAALRALAEAHVLDVEVMRTTELETVGGLGSVGLVLTGALPEPALEGFLASLGTASPLFEVTALDLRRARAVSRADPRRRLAVQVAVRSYLAP